MNNILLTGTPRSGKTTVVQNVVRKLDRCAGFYTQEMKEGNVRVGFRLVTLDNKECILSHKRTKSPYRVGAYRVDCDCIERLGVAAVVQGIEKGYTVIIDEIGKMELFSNSFKHAVIRALESGSPVLATILLHPHPFCDEIKKRKDTEIIEVTEANRDGLPATILDRLQ
jgi:nucleoside-triphosphatase THEP1